MTATAQPAPYIAALALAQQALTSRPRRGFKWSMPPPNPPTKAQLAAAARKASRAAQEAASLRANLHRRKAQARARPDDASAQPHNPNQATPGAEKCR